MSARKAFYEQIARQNLAPLWSAFAGSLREQREADAL
jgi:hypothetical protein